RMRKLVLALSAATGMALSGMSYQPLSALAETTAQGPVESKQLDRLIAVFEGIRANHVDLVDETKLVDAAIKGMLGTLTTQADYLDARRFRDMQITDHRYLVGLGIDAIMDKGLFRIVTPLDDSPAAKAGVLAGDVITHIDGVPLQGLSTDQVADKVLGKV